MDLPRDDVGALGWIERRPGRQASGLLATARFRISNQRQLVTKQIGLACVNKRGKSKSGSQQPNGSIGQVVQAVRPA